MARILDELNRGSIKEIQTMLKPSPVIVMVVSAVMTVLGKDPNWPKAKLELSDPNILMRLKIVEGLTEDTYNKL